MSRRRPRTRPAQQVGLIYAAAVGSVTLGLQMLPHALRTHLVLAVSTDPDRLLQHPARSLLLSSLVVPSVAGLWLLPGTVLTLGIVQRARGTRATISAAALGHAGVSVTVAVLLEHRDHPPMSAATADVGVSYVLAMTAGLALATAPAPWRATGAAVGTAAVSGLFLVGRTSTDIGHLLAWLLGLTVALLERAGHRARAGQEKTCST